MTAFVPLFLRVHHIPKVLYWIEICWLWMTVEFSELIVMFKKPAWDDLRVMWHVILLLVAITRWVHCGQQQYSGRLWCLNNAKLVLGGPKFAKKIFCSPLPAWTIGIRQDVSMLSCCLCQILTLTSKCHSRNFSKLLLFKFREPCKL